MIRDSVKILVVDDDPDVLFATTRAIKSAGYDVANASSCAECRELLTGFRPDLLLLDVMLPDGNGRDLCREIKANPQTAHLFIILLSGVSTSSANQAKGLDDGADGYIARPISNMELKARVNAMVRIVTAERQRDEAIAKYRDALEKIRQLQGLVPICSHCKKIRNDKGFWNHIEEYIDAHLDVSLSHSICPDCAEENYPGLNLYDD